MQIDPRTLEGLPRDQLIERARRVGVRRPELLTRVELKDEIVRMSETDERKRRAARGWFGVARDLLASVVEQGLHMPDAAKLIRGEPILGDSYKVAPPVATVTLAEIYVAQGHTQRALSILDEVLEREPDHEAARGLRERLTADSERSSPDAAPEPPAEDGADAEDSADADDGADAEAAPDADDSADAEAAAEPDAPVSAPGDQVEAWRPATPAPVPEPIAAEAEPRAARAADVVVTIAEAPGRVYLYWEVSERSLRRAERRHAGGHAAIRLLEVRPSWDGAERVERELDVDLPSGSQRVSVAESALVRAAIGWRSPQGFVPFAVGTELSPPAGNGAEQSLGAPERRALRGYRAK